MRYDLRPRSFVEILDLSLRLLRADFARLAGVTLAFYLPYRLLTSLCTVKLEPGVVPELVGELLAPTTDFVLMGLVLPVGQLAATRMTADAYLGESTRLSHALRDAAKRYASSAGTFLLRMLALYGAALLLVIPALYLVVCWALLESVLVMEQRSGRAALKRSNDLVRGYWWSTACVIAAAALMSASSNVISVLFGSAPLLVAMVEGIGTAYLTVVMVVLYFDLRCRKEDFDLTHLAQQVGRDGVAGLSGIASAGVSAADVSSR